MLYSSVKNIEVLVQTDFSKLQSNIVNNDYFYIYNITIHNHSKSPVQLLSRKWFIVDCLGQNRVVEGEGVVGVQPIIKAGNSYNYYSGCHLKSPYGKMYGNYTFINLIDNLTFKVNIPEFNLILPWIKN